MNWKARLNNPMGKKKKGGREKRPKKKPGRGKKKSPRHGKRGK